MVGRYLMYVFKKRHYSNCRYLILICTCLFFIGCRTTRIPSDGTTTTDIRNGISELEREQSEAAKLEQEIADRLERETDHYRRIDAILQQIRKQLTEGTPGTRTNDTRE